MGPKGEAGIGEGRRGAWAHTWFPVSLPRVLPEPPVSQRGAECARTHHALFGPPQVPKMKTIIITTTLWLSKGSQTQKPWGLLGPPDLRESDKSQALSLGVKGMRTRAAAP